MRRLRLVLAFFFVVVPAGTACERADASGETDVVRVPVTVETEGGLVTFQSEIADSPAERQRGLMFRTELGDREGMLFLFPAEQQLSFWMKDTFISLDLIFIRSDRTILGIVAEAEPETLSSRMVPGRSQYVLEIRGGLADALGIRSGQTVRFMAPPALR